MHFKELLSYPGTLLVLQSKQKDSQFHWHGRVLQLDQQDSILDTSPFLVCQESGEIVYAHRCMDLLPLILDPAKEIILDPLLYNTQRVQKKNKKQFI